MTTPQSLNTMSATPVISSRSPLTDLGLPTRIVNILKAQNVVSVGDLQCLARKDARQLIGLGRSGLQRLDDFMANHNLIWADQVPPPASATIAQPPATNLPSHWRHLAEDFYWVRDVKGFYEAAEVYAVNEVSTEPIESRIAGVPIAFPSVVSFYNGYGVGKTFIGATAVRAKDISRALNALYGEVFQETLQQTPPTGPRNLYDVVRQMHEHLAPGDNYFARRLAEIEKRALETPPEIHHTIWQMLHETVHNWLPTHSQREARHHAVHDLLVNRIS